jgi:poly-beta-1,6-N-acetyl-D-glucosamine synthase
MSNGPRILVISPCRDEAMFMRRTLESVARQTLTPTRWIVVDDGSTDETPRILREYAERLPYLKVVKREDRGRRSVGPGVIEAFYAGLETVNLDDFDYVCKLDLDLQLPQKYFEVLVRRMEADPHLGTCSGKPYYPDQRTGRLLSEGCGDENSVGMTKFYRVKCFREIGGFVREVMWDGIDGHRCRMAGWRAHSWDEEDLRFVHLRPMGSSDKGIWTGRKRHGFGQYFMGTAPLYMLASSVYRSFRKPYFVGGAGMLVGYMNAAMSGAPRYQDREFRRFLRSYQRECLLHGKRVATERLERRMLEMRRGGSPRGGNVAGATRAHGDSGGVEVRGRAPAVSGN